MVISLVENRDLFGEIIPTAPDIDRAQLASVLHALTKDLTLEQLVALLTNEVEESLEYVDLCRGKKACQKTSLLFNPHRLDVHTKGHKLSVYSAFKSEAFPSNLARALIFKKEVLSNQTLLYQVLQLGVGFQYVNEFPPHLARDIAKRNRLDRASRVLDPCAGWGGRMIGLSVIVDSYTAYEPSTKTHSGLIKLGEYLQKWRSSFNPTVYCAPFEDSQLEPASFDFAMTSPPYYDTEHYTDEPSNSMNRYSSFEDWVEGFYCPLIEKTMAALKPGAEFWLNIGSRTYALNAILNERFAGRFSIERVPGIFAESGGLRKSAKEGEMFYAIKRAPSHRSDLFRTGELWEM